MDLICSCCTRVQVLNAKTINLRDKDGEFVCSPSCLLQWFLKRSSADIDLIPAGKTHQWCGGTGDIYSEKLKIFFRSEYEKRVAEFFDSNELPFYYEKFAYKVPSKGGSHSLYVPDFILPSCNSVVEVKGRWMPGSRAKLRRFRSIYPDIPIIVLVWPIQGHDEWGEKIVCKQD